MLPICKKQFLNPFQVKSVIPKKKGPHPTHPKKKKGFILTKKEPYKKTGPAQYTILLPEASTGF